MNGYTVLAESYKKLKEQGKITAEQAEARERVLQELRYTLNTVTAKEIIEREG